MPKAGTPGGGGDAGAAAGRRPRSAGRGGADVGPRPRVRRRPLPGGAAPGRRLAELGVAAGEGLSGTLEVDHGAVDVSAETSRRISCDASVVPMRHGADGAVLDVGRKTRTIPPSIRRALQARDRSCRFPGCTARRCDAHHVRALDRRRRHEPRQPGAAVPAPSPGRPRRRIRVEAARERDDDVPAARWDGARGRASLPLHLEVARRQSACRSRHPGLGRHAVRCRLCDRRALQAVSRGGA